MGFLVFPVGLTSAHSTSEKLVLTGRGQVTSRVPTLGPFHIQASSVPPKEIKHRHPILSGGPYYLGLSLGSPLGSQGWSLSSTKLIVTMGNPTVDA